MNQVDINEILILSPLFIGLLSVLGLLIKTIIFGQILCKLKIIEEIKRNGEVKYIIYQKFSFLSKKTDTEFIHYSEAFDYVTKHEAKHLELKEKKRQQKVIKRKTRLNIK